MDYIIEFLPQGRYVKVTAIDPVSGREAVIVGDASQSQKTLAQNAINKLNYLLKK
ncbi:MAG: hypothetical protein K2X09_04995 [Rickettsiales bacterium]|nr:hypothetical protein [Rickettsiales bacterium]